MKSVALVVAFTRVPNVSIIVSRGSTSLSSLPFEDIVTVPVVEPAAIVIGLAEMVYSSVIVAVPLIVKGIETSCSLACDKVAVKVISVEEFSSILSALSAKVTTGGSSSSVMVIVDSVEIELVALVGEVLGVTIIVSPASSIESSIPVNVIFLL